MNILTNWIVKDNKKLENVVSFSSQNTDATTDNIEVEKCVCLIRDENVHVNSMPEIEIASENVLKQIEVFSEGSLVEVFGKNDEYLFTCKSNFIDDWEGIAVYYTKIILLDLDLLFCKLKFGRIKDQSRLWLYNIQITLDKLISADLTKTTTFNLGNVDKLLTLSNMKISERAEKFKTFFETFNSSPKNQFNFRFSNLESILSNLNCEKTLKLMKCENSNETDTLNITKQSDVRNLRLQKLGLTKCLPIIEENTEAKCSGLIDTELLINYINKKFSEMQQDLISHIDFKINELRLENNSNFQKILGLLNTANK